VAVADFNGDGKPDLAVANAGSNTVSLLVNETAPGTPTPSFAAAVNSPTGSEPFFVAVADFNGDGLPDHQPLRTDRALLRGGEGLHQGRQARPRRRPGVEQLGVRTVEHDPTGLLGFLLRPRCQHPHRDRTPLRGGEELLRER
jgi:hypothetical protein